MHPLLLIAREQFASLPILAAPETCSGKTYIVTGANVGLGLETARHPVAASAGRVILCVRNVEAGERAKADIEKTTERAGVAEVWRVDLAEFESVRGFVERAKRLGRVDALVGNAGVYLDQWTTAEQDETTMTVNVVSTFLMGMLMMPKLRESAKRYGVKPTLVMLVSVLAFPSKVELDKGGKVSIFKGLNDSEKQVVDLRYGLTKLLQLYLVREFAANFPVENTGVVINMVSPGFCTTHLGRDAKTTTRAVQGVLRKIMARSAEQGSRAILHGILADEETHGKFLSDCVVKE